MMRALFPLFFVLSLLTGCSGSGGRIECSDNAGCQNQACVDNQCVDVDCLNSNDCNLYEYCSDVEYTCVSGCSADTDCMAGESCDVETNTCIEYGCRDTQLDCPIGDYCNRNSGDCYDDPEGTCDFCTEDQSYADQLELLFGGSLQDRHCVQWDAAGTTFYWLSLCNPNQGSEACPRGFACYENIYDPSSGLEVAACIGDCDYYRQEGYL